METEYRQIMSRSHLLRVPNNTSASFSVLDVLLDTDACRRLGPLASHSSGVFQASVVPAVVQTLLVQMLPSVTRPQRVRDSAHIAARSNAHPIVPEFLSSKSA